MTETFNIDIPHMGTKLSIPMVLMFNYANSFLKINTKGYKITRNPIETNKMIKTNFCTRGPF